MKEIPLTRGYVALVDDEDYERVVASGSWCARPNGRTVYAQQRATRADGRGTTIQLHQFIAGTTHVDHKNGDGLDNQRSNLRVATQGQNMFNKRLYASSTSGFKGVTRRKGTGKWAAQIQGGGHHRYLGQFATPEEAARAYDVAAVELFGEFARLNFPGGSDVITG